jgi:hypothetical protein
VRLSARRVKRTRFLSKAAGRQLRRSTVEDIRGHRESHLDGRLSDVGFNGLPHLVHDRLTQLEEMEEAKGSLAAEI